MGNSDAITHFIASCYEQKSTSLGSHEVFRGAPKYDFYFNAIALVFLYNYSA